MPVTYLIIFVIVFAAFDVLAVNRERQRGVEGEIQVDRQVRGN